MSANKLSEYYVTAYFEELCSEMCILSYTYKLLSSYIIIPLL